MDYELFEDIGQLKREHGGINEDSVAANVFEQAHRDKSRSLGLFALADGAGGHDAGDVASYLATTLSIEYLSDYLFDTLQATPDDFDVDTADGLVRDQPTDQAISSALEEAVNYTQRAIIEYAKEAGKDEVYTTLVVGVYLDGTLHYGWYGDSRAYLVNEANEDLIPLTEDHSQVEELLASGEITEAEAQVHPDGNRSALIGGSQFQDPEAQSVSIETGTVDLYAEDILLLTSDGIIDAANLPERRQQLYQQYQEADDKERAAKQIFDAVVTEDEIRDEILNAESLSWATDQLIDLANEYGGKDNISGILATDTSLPPTPEDVGPRGLQEEPIEEMETTIQTEAQAETSNEEKSVSSGADCDSVAASSEVVATDASGAAGDGKEANTSGDTEKSDVDEATDQSDARLEGIAEFFPDEMEESPTVTEGMTIGRAGTRFDPTLALEDETGLIAPEHAAFDYDRADGWVVRDTSSHGGTLIHREESGDWIELRSQKGQEKLHRRDETADLPLVERWSLEDGDRIALVNPNVVQFTFRLRE